MNASSSRETSPRWLRIAATVVGLGLLGVWLLWWGVSLKRFDLVGAENTWIGVPAFGVDFWTQSEWAARMWGMGKDPYVNDHLFHYPPLVIFLFAWVIPLQDRTALMVWIIALMVIIALGTFLAWRWRKLLGLDRAPFVLVLGAVMFSFPVLFALERSNFDLITLVAIMLALGVKDRKPPWTAFLAGCILAVGPWVKLYPGLIGVAIVSLRWWRVLGGFAFGGVTIGLITPTETLKSFENIRVLIAQTQWGTVVDLQTYFPWSHSLSSALTKLFFLASQKYGYSALEHIPGSVASLAVLSPLLGWVCWRVYKCPRRSDFAYPLMLWVVALASFVPQMANDYSLVFLPLAAVAVWSLRDPWYVQLMIGLMLVFLQPWALPVPNALFFVFKLIGLVGVGVCLALRTRDSPLSDLAHGESPQRSQPATVPA